MAFDLDLLEGLLHEDEGTSLDFKGAQYPFENAPAEQKAELLKDVLAFANSWRRTTAYLLIGVEEVKGGRSKIVGVNKHLDDAKLHQFVNSKTQRAIEFCYRIVPIEGVEIGVIEIPLEERPVYLKKQYGNLRENAVYIRDGSSTRVATPDEIARMGVQRVLEKPPQFVLDWANLERRNVLPSPCVLNTLILSPQLPESTFALTRSNYQSLDTRNSNYPQEVIYCTLERAFFSSLGICIHNDSSVVGKRVRFEGTLRKSDGVFVQDQVEETPSKSIYGAVTPRDLVSLNGTPGEVDLQEYENRWEIAVDFGDIRPQQKVWMASPLWFGSAHCKMVKLHGQLFADNLPEPISYSLEIKFEVEQRGMTMDDALPLLDQ